MRYDDDDGTFTRSRAMKVHDPKPDVPPGSSETGDAGRDGYTVLGKRSPLGRPGDMVPNAEHDRLRDMMADWPEDMPPDM